MKLRGFNEEDHGSLVEWGKQPACHNGCGKKVDQGVKSGRSWRKDLSASLILCLEAKE